ncbi:YbjN domain-containing protein [Niveispirillum sp. KHB5.9]|uniref:YbjN domain-containing protein n=1 Tax=Niveispirillum sp. KHB5.9 TaxID=3400269 RepID=UPI003A838D19
MLDNLLRGVTVADLEAAMERLGLPAEQDLTPSGSPVLRSAIGGLTFNIRPGALIDQEAGRYGDYNFNLMFQVQERFDASLLNQWNRHKRFARLSLRDDFLVLEMDCLSVGIAGDQILASLELWGRLVVEALNFLRTAHGGAAGNT